MARRMRVAVPILLGALVLIALVAELVLETAANRSGPVTGVVAFLLAVAFLAFLRHLDVDRLLRALDALRFSAPIFAYVVASIFVGDREGEMEFNEVAAQVIVVLLLALVSVVFTFLVLAAGEYYALNGVLTEKPAPAEVIAGAIAAGFAAIGVGALAGPRRSGDPRE